MAATDITWPLLLDLSSAYAAANPEVAVVPSLAPQAALAGLLAAGQVDLALTTAPDSSLFATPIGYVPFQVVVHPSNTLKGVSLPQMQGLLAGRIVDWSRVGGPSGPVLVVARGNGTDAAQALAATAMGPVTVTASARLAPTWAAMRELVGANPGAIGYLIAPEVDASVKFLPLSGADGTPVHPRLLAAAQATSDPGGPARAFLAWAQSAAGQAAVGKRNVALKP